MDNSIHTDANGHALAGHDPVAYFTLGKQTKGDPSITSEWSGATWLFATAEHRDLFEKDQASYAPAFGGHCAVGRVFGASFPGSPKRWRIDDGRLFVNKNRFVDLQFPLFARRARTLADTEDRR